jgi:hypothetical protein
MAFAATGRPPYGGGSYEEIFFRIVSGRADLAGVPAPLVPLLSAALDRDPARRPSAGQLSAQVCALDLPPASPDPAAVSPARTGVLSGGVGGNGDNGRKSRKGRKGRKGPKPANPKVPQAPKAPDQAPGPAYPAPKQAAKDVADLLPPVSYSPLPPAGYAPFPPSGFPPPGLAAGGLAGRGRLNPSAPAGAAGPPRPQGRTAMAGLAIMVSAVALTMVLPVAGLVVSLAAMTLLRAADRAQSTLAVRRSVRGPRASDPLVVVVMAPLTVARALLAEVLLAPLAFLAGAATYAATTVLSHSLSPAGAGAYAAAAIVAAYGIGPGSGRPRRQLNRMAGALSRSRLAAAAIALAVWALAVAAVIFAVSQTPYYWPATTVHLPVLHSWAAVAHELHSLVSSTANWLVRHVHA